MKPPPAPLPSFGPQRGIGGAFTSDTLHVGSPVGGEFAGCHGLYGNAGGGGGHQLKGQNFGVKATVRRIVHSIKLTDKMTALEKFLEYSDVLSASLVDVQPCMPHFNCQSH